MTNLVSKSELAVWKFKFWHLLILQSLQYFKYFTRKLISRTKFLSLDWDDGWPGWGLEGTVLLILLSVQRSLAQCTALPTLTGVNLFKEGIGSVTRPHGMYWSVGWSVRPNFLKGLLEVTLPCSKGSTCWYPIRYNSPFYRIYIKWVLLFELSRHIIASLETSITE